MYQSISIQDFKVMLSEEPVTLLDVRDENTFELGHIKGAGSLPITELPNSIQYLDKETPYYVICQHGINSEVACTYLSNLGFKVINVLGGMSAWKEKTYSFAKAC